MFIIQKCMVQPLYALSSEKQKDVSKYRLVK